MTLLADEERNPHANGWLFVTQQRPKRLIAKENPIHSMSKRRQNVISTVGGFEPAHAFPSARIIQSQTECHLSSCAQQTSDNSRLLPIFTSCASRDVAMILVSFFG